MSTEDNMKLWDEVKQPPSTALRAIQGGRLKGKSDIAPQWRYEELTRHFGMIGFGWKYEVVGDPRFVTGSDHQIAVFVNINLFVKVDGEWSDAIPGSGGSMFIEKETKGPFTSDEAVKMATTDALSVACKMLGFASDVYAGFWDGSKYNRPEDPKPVTDADHKKTVTGMTKDLSKGTTPEAVSKWWTNNAKKIADLPQKFKGQVTKEFGDYKKKTFVVCPGGKVVNRKVCPKCKDHEGCESLKQ